MYGYFLNVLVFSSHQNLVRVVAMALKSFTRLNFFKLCLWPIFVAELGASRQKPLATEVTMAYLTLETNIQLLR